MTQILSCSCKHDKPLQLFHAPACSDRFAESSCRSCSSACSLSRRFSSVLRRFSFSWWRQSSNCWSLSAPWCFCFGSQGFHVGNYKILLLGTVVSYRFIRIQRFRKHQTETHQFKHKLKGSWLSNCLSCCNFVLSYHLQTPCYQCFPKSFVDKSVQKTSSLWVCSLVWQPLMWLVL